MRNAVSARLRLKSVETLHEGWAVRIKGDRIEAVGHIRQQFGGFPRLTAWCCRPS